MSIYFTSDSHFSHTNIIKYCNRPFANTHEMNRAMVNNWNTLVKPEDTVFHLGDVALGPKNTLELIKELNGYKILIKGNHDRSLNVMKDYFNEVYNELVIKIEDKDVLLKHKPVIGYFPQWKQVCGHVHDRWLIRGKILNVGMDMWDFTPVSLEKVAFQLSLMTDEEYHPTLPAEIEHDS